jgi:hypothetical protein
MGFWRRFRIFWKWLDAILATEPERRSLRLMQRWLSADQKEQFDAYGYFDVLGSHSCRRYRIRIGTSTNILELDGYGHSVAGWCFTPAGNLPTGDVMLAQKIALENDEQSALAVARSFPPYP